MGYRIGGPWGSAETPPVKKVEIDNSVKEVKDERLLVVVLGNARLKNQSCEGDELAAALQRWLWIIKHSFRQLALTIIFIGYTHCFGG